MSSRVGVRELRQQTSAVLKRVAAGETVEVTDHGHPVARIVPIRPSILEQLIAEGLVIPAQGDPNKLLDELSLPMPPKGPMLPSEALQELREEG